MNKEEEERRKILEKQKMKLKKQQKYKKAHKENYLKINKMHLKHCDPLNDYQKLLEEQKQSEEKRINSKSTKPSSSSSSSSLTLSSNAMVGFVSPIPKSRIEIYEGVKKLKDEDGKAYLRLVTNKGNLNIELYCNLVPKTCDNFLSLCDARQFNGSKFHRLIKDFMIQGGRRMVHGSSTPISTSFWGSPFEDEFHNSLRHNTRGILSMANAGSNTNGSEFFITFVKCPHLDGKHTVFGKVVGGQGTLDHMEQVKTNSLDVPIQEQIIIQDVIIYVNPFKRFIENA